MYTHTTSHTQTKSLPSVVSRLHERSSTRSVLSTSSPIAVTSCVCTCVNSNNHMAGGTAAGGKRRREAHMVVRERHVNDILAAAEGHNRAEVLLRKINALHALEVELPAARLY